MAVFDFLPGTVGSMMGATASIKVIRPTTSWETPGWETVGETHSDQGFPVETSWFDMEGYVSAPTPSEKFSQIVSDRYYPSCAKVSLLTANKFSADYVYVDPDTAKVDCDFRFVAGDDFREDNKMVWFGRPNLDAPQDGTGWFDGSVLEGQWTSLNVSDEFSPHFADYYVWDENFKGFESNSAVQFTGNNLAETPYDIDVGTTFGLMGVFVLSNRKTKPHLITVTGDSMETGSLVIDPNTGSLVAQVANTERARITFNSVLWNKPVLIGIQFDTQQKEFTFFVKGMKRKLLAQKVDFQSSTKKMKIRFFDTPNENSCELLDVAVWKNLTKKERWDNAIETYTAIYGV